MRYLGTYKAGTKATATTAAALSTTQACQEVIVQNLDGTIHILVGDAASQPIDLAPGIMIRLLVRDLADIYVKSASGTPNAGYIAMG